MTPLCRASAVRANAVQLALVHAVVRTPCSATEVSLPADVARRRSRLRGWLEPARSSTRRKNSSHCRRWTRFGNRWPSRLPRHCSTCLWSSRCVGCRSRARGSVVGEPLETWSAACRVFPHGRSGQPTEGVLIAIQPPFEHVRERMATWVNPSCKLAWPLHLSPKSKNAESAKVRTERGRYWRRRHTGDGRTVTSLGVLVGLPSVQR